LPTLPPSPWFEFLVELDLKLNTNCKLPVFGGFAVTLQYGISRLTSDIDVLDVAPPHILEVLQREAGLGSPLSQRHRVYLDFVGMANPPINYDQRLCPMFPGVFRRVGLFVMDPYDVALTKLKRDSDKDVQDVLQLAAKIPFDLDLFEDRYIAELRDNTVGSAKDNDAVFYRWIEAIRENREMLKQQ
jgi:hypothetical protein